VRNALSTLPWVEKGSIAPDVTRQEVTFGFKKKEDFNFDQVKTTIEEKTSFKVGKVVKQP
jgi:hypothetical protein